MRHRGPAVDPSRLIRLYPRDWRARYETELTAVLDARPNGFGDRLDLLRGALDAHLHPRTPSLVPGIASITAGALWILVASAVLAEPVPPDWPGYLSWTLPLGLFGAVATTMATIAVAVRDPGTSARVAIPVTAGLLVWIAVLAVAVAGGPYGSVTGAAQAMAAVAVIAIGLDRVRRGDASIGQGVVLAGSAMLLLPPLGWLLAGAVWSVIGLTQLAGRSTADPSVHGGW